MWPWKKSLLPPWEKYPDLQRWDLGWRMGYGEDYLDRFNKWFDRCSLKDRQKYIRQYPAPAEWHGFYGDPDN